VSTAEKLAGVIACDFLTFAPIHTTVRQYYLNYKVYGRPIHIGMRIGDRRKGKI
jgi:hypothetical protein